MHRLILIAGLLFSVGRVAAAEPGARTANVPAKPVVIPLTYPESVPVIEVMLDGKPVRFAIATEEPVSWLRPGVAAGMVIKDPAHAPGWVQASIAWKDAGISGEMFLVRDAPVPGNCQGVLGHSTLREFCLTMDFTANSLTISGPASAPELTKDDAFTLELDEHPVAVGKTKLHITGGQVLLPVRLGDGALLPLAAATVNHSPLVLISSALLKARRPDLLPKSGNQFTAAELRVGRQFIKEVPITVSDARTASGRIHLAQLGRNPLVLNYPSRLGAILYHAGNAVSAELAHLGLKLTGNGSEFAVAEIDPTGPAAAAGLRKGDMIRQYMGIPMRFPFSDALRAAMDGADDPVSLTWQRGTAKPETTNIPRRNQSLKDPRLAGLLRRSDLPETAKGDVIPLQSSFVGYSIEIRVNGKPLRALVDTGSDGTVLSPAAAARLGIRSEEETRVNSISGVSVASGVGVASTLNFGSAVISDEPVHISPLPEPFEALLGMATLRDFDVRIDPRERTLTLWRSGKAPALPGETVMPLTVPTKNMSPGSDNPQHWQLTPLTISASIAGKEVRCIPDTGFGGILQLSAPLAESILPGIGATARAALPTGTGLAGIVATRSIRLPSFTFGPDTLKDLPADLVDIPNGSGMEDRAILGMGILRHSILTIDFAAGRLRLLPLGTIQDLTRSSTAGMNLGFKDDTIVILSVEPRGASDQAGLLAGDAILEIGGIPIGKLTPEQLASFKRLPPGSAVAVKYQRGNSDPDTVRVILQKE